ERAAKLAPSQPARNLLSSLHILVSAAKTGSNNRQSLLVDQRLYELSRDELRRLLELVQSIGEPDTTCALLRPLRTARTESRELEETFFEVLLAKAYSMVERSEWFGAEQLLAPYADDAGLDVISAPLRTAFFNLSGCCACLNQDFKTGLQ